jgi:thiamine-phosphate pyrophosphorylase
MPLNLEKPILYLITSGETTTTTTSSSKELLHLLKLFEAAVAAGINLLQIREKNLTARTLYELTVQAASITAGSETSLLVNDRADIAEVAGADGVHLTTTSMNAGVMRKTFGDRLGIGVSTHSVGEAEKARAEDADFVVFGPVFETASKQKYGEAVGTTRLREVVSRVNQMPVVALGGVSLNNAADCFRAGASGIAAIRLFQDPSSLAEVVTSLRAYFDDVKNEF